MFRMFLTLAVLAGMSGPALADVCAANSQKAAENAVVLLKYLPAVQMYCAPCGDKTAQRKTIGKVSAVKDKDDDYYRVVVDDEAIDLAYVFVPKSSTSPIWVNLGLMTTCAAPAEFDTLQLPDNLVAK